jgi:hypothetical protein
MRLCNPELSVSSEAKQAAGIVLPYLLHEGWCTVGGVVFAHGCVGLKRCSDAAQA